MTHNIATAARARDVVRFWIAFAVSVWAGMAMADEAQDRAALNAALRLDETLVIMRDEGLTFGAGIGQDFLPDGGGAGWRALVSQLYDPARTGQAVKQRLARELPANHLASLLAFYTSGTGQRIIAQEIDARRAFLVSSVEETAGEAWDEAQAGNEARTALIMAYMEANDLVEYNVAGGLNSTLRFYQGLATSDAYDMSEEDMLRDVWQQEGDTRISSERWLGSYLWLAYSPLEDADIKAYVEFSRTPAGQALNAALFAGFDAMYGDLSYALGLGVAAQLVAKEL